LFADIVAQLSNREPNCSAAISEAQTLSYRILAERINRYARWALSEGIADGDTVCLIMSSRPDHIAVWLRISKVGAIVALINTRLVGPSVSHCINIAATHYVVVGSDRADALEAALPQLNRARSSV
jgi:fatty-acyl-CoA synthase